MTTITKRIAQVIPPCILLLVVGCATNAGGHLPPGARLVGGGLQISWVPPSDGTAILVEATTGTPVATKAVEAGDAFEFDVSSEGDADVLRAVLPNMPNHAKFLLYFVPSPQED